MSERSDLNIAGKDWLTEPEAAFYCGVSLTHFRRNYFDLGITPKNFLGKKLFSKHQLMEVIERSDAWHREPVRAPQIPAFVSASPLPPGVNLRPERCRPFKARKRGSP